MLYFLAEEWFYSLNDITKMYVVFDDSIKTYIIFKELCKKGNEQKSKTVLLMIFRTILLL